MSLLTRKEFDNYDTAVLYVTTCSDVEASFKNSRRFLECKVVGSNPGFNGKDKRYFVQCAEPLRKDGYKLGLYSAEAMVSEYSPFLMSEEFFNEFFMFRDYDNMTYRLHHTHIPMSTYLQTY